MCTGIDPCTGCAYHCNAHCVGASTSRPFHSSTSLDACSLPSGVSVVLFLCSLFSFSFAFSSLDCLPIVDYVVCLELILFLLLIECSHSQAVGCLFLDECVEKR